SGVVPSQSSNVNTSANGSAPLVARSLHATCTASRPRCSRAVVMGSQVTTAAHLPKSRTAQSSPMPARRNTSGRRPKYGYTSRARSSGGTFPGRIARDPHLTRGLKPYERSALPDHRRAHRRSEIPQQERDGNRDHETADRLENVPGDLSRRSLAHDKRLHDIVP